METCHTADRLVDGKSECAGNAESARSIATNDWRTIRCETESREVSGTIPDLDADDTGHVYL